MEPIKDVYSMICYKEDPKYSCTPHTKQGKGNPIQFLKAVITRDLDVVSETWGRSILQVTKSDRLTDKREYFDCEVVDNTMDCESRKKK